MPKANESSIYSAKVSLRLVMACALLAGTMGVRADARQSAGAPDRTDLDAARSRLKQGDFFPADIDLISRKLGPQAIPEFKAQFELEKDGVNKDKLAATLIQIGDKDPKVWNYLVAGAIDALASDRPAPQRFDAHGKTVSGPSPEYLSWAKAHNLTIEEADDITIRDSSKIAYLAETGDRRAIPLLRQALLSPDFTIEAFAARGLAEMHDNASIPLIIEACRAAPGDAAATIAHFSFRHFNDPQAQAAAKEFLPATEPK